MTEHGTALRLSVSRRGVIDSLAKGSQALHVMAHFLRADNQDRNAITAEILSAYLEALAAATEQDLEATLAQQLVPLVIGLAESAGEDDLEERTRRLQEEVEVMLGLLKEATTEEGDKMILILPGNDTVH